MAGGHIPDPDLALVPVHQREDVPVLVPVPVPIPVPVHQRDGCVPIPPKQGLPGPSPGEFVLPRRWGWGRCSCLWGLGWVGLFIELINRSLQGGGGGGGGSKCQPKPPLWCSAYPHQPYIGTFYLSLLRRRRPKLVLTRTGIPCSAKGGGGGGGGRIGCTCNEDPD